MSPLSQTKLPARDNDGITVAASHPMKSASRWLKVSNRKNLAKNSSENREKMKTLNIHPLLPSAGPLQNSL